MEEANENAISIAFGVERNSAMDRGRLADLTAFVAVADRLCFRAARAPLALPPSALSHSMRQLEERLGVRLLHRTTRSVSLTDAGRRLLDRLRPARRARMLVIRQRLAVYTFAQQGTPR